MEHRFRWLWNFTFIPLVLVILGFGFHIKNKADEKLTDTNASIGIITKNIDNINNEIKTLNSKASTDVLLSNYTEVNKALGVATQRVIDLQNKRLDAYSIGDAVERNKKLDELKPVQNELFKNGYNGAPLLIFDKSWKMVPSTSTPFSQNVIPVVFKIEDGNGTLKGAAFMNYYVTTDSFELVNVGYVENVERLAL